MQKILQNLASQLAGGQRSTLLKDRLESRIRKFDCDSDPPVPLAFIFNLSHHQSEYILWSSILHRFDLLSISHAKSYSTRYCRSGHEMRPITNSTHQLECQPYMNESNCMEKVCEILHKVWFYRKSLHTSLLL